MELLEEIFLRYCKHFRGRLRWTQKKKKFSPAVLDFFSDLAKERENIRGESEYLRIDYVWHFETKNSHHIELAVEHENECRFQEFLEKEIQHLIDVKAANKVAITYPSLGDESTLVEEIRRRVKFASLRLSTPEKYLIIFGFTTTKTEVGRKRRAIEFKTYYIEHDGELSRTDEKVVLQGPRTYTITIRAVARGKDGVERELNVPFRIRRVARPEET